MSAFYNFDSGHSFWGAPRRPFNSGFTSSPTLNAPEQLPTGNAGNQRKKNRRPKGISDFVNQGDIGALAELQVARNQEARDASIANRDAAVAELRNYLGGINQRNEDVYNQLSTDFTNTPFNNFLSQSIRDRIENPDVISQGAVQNFQARTRDAAGSAIDSARRNMQISSAQRGVTSGIDQRLMAQLGLEGSAAAEAQGQEYETLAAQLRSENLAGAQQLGSEFSNNLSAANNQRLATLANFQNNTDAQNLSVVNSIADILASTVFEPDDLSGFATLAAGVKDRAFALQQHEDNLSALYRQLDILESQGIRDSNLQARALSAQSQYNNQLAELSELLNSIL